MTNRKSTKRRLLASALTLVICVAMLVGTTFAWFTDSVTSSGNIIKSGTLDVEMYWKDATTTGKQLTYKDASEGAIFNYDLWEPGYVEAKNIKISNVGTLALKYNLNIAANGEVSELADVIDVYFAEGEYTLENREMSELKLAGTLSDILDGMPANMSGDLEAGKDDIVTIALKMQETAGNEYQDLSIGTDFSVILMATQDTVEADSFDENYDDIEVPEYDTKVIDGNTYYYYNNGEVVLATVPYGNVGATFNVPADVTVLGQGDVYAGAVPVFSKSSPIETITLPEGLKEIKARAITGVKTLTSINFPSTLTAIRAQALRQTGMNELNIPANVKFIGDGAFRDMANLTTVTVNGNVAFENYAFRSCPNLTSVYLLGDDVTFNGSMFATHSDNGDANGITIYVKNATVAARVYAAQTSAYGYEVKIIGDAADGSDAQTIPQVKTQAALTAAIANDQSVVLAAGNYVMPDSSDSASLKNDTVSIVGTKGAVIDMSGVDTRDQFVIGADLTFDGVTLNFGTADYMGFANFSNLTYKNCTINGYQYLIGDKATFENCEINSTGYCVNTYGCKDVTFTGCTFNSAGKAILVYRDDPIVSGYSDENVIDLSVTDCTFNASAPGYAGAISNMSCAAIEIHNYRTGVDLTTSGNVIDSDFSGEWRIKTYEDTTTYGNTVTVNGTEYTQCAVDGKLFTVTNKVATYN